jgi:hypothetical protein
MNNIVSGKANDLIQANGEFNALALLKESSINLPQKSLEKIADRLPELARALNTTGRRNTQTTSQLMTLNMAGDEPYRHLRQILVQIEKKKTSLEESAFKYKKDEIRKKKLLEKGDELALLSAQEMDCRMIRSKVYIEGIVKEIGMFQDVYDEIREAHGIPENWDELDVEKNEVRHHIKMGFRMAFQEIMAHGMVGRGSAEYLEQFGVHPQVARKHLQEYIIANEELLKQGKEPTIEHLHNFLDAMADKYKDAHKANMKRIGIKNLIHDDFIFRELK